MIEQKICIKCGESKNLSMYNNDPKFKDGLKSRCKYCIKIQRAEHYKQNRERIRETSNGRYDNKKRKEYREKNRDKISAWHKQNHKENRDKINEYKRERYKKDDAVKAESTARVARRRAALMQRTPKWLDEYDRIVMSNLYKTRKDISKEMGIEFHVDHIYPLQGKTVSGFHCPDNLRIITATENLSKNNRLEVAV